jgi:hypothetical protein
VGCGSAAVVACGPASRRLEMNIADTIATNMKVLTIDLTILDFLSESI